MKTKTTILTSQRFSLKRTMLLLTMFLGVVFTWQAEAQTQGESCDAPITVSSLPFTDSGSTSDYGNNYGSADVPTTAPGAITNGTGSGSYLNGDDVVFAYIPTMNQIINVTTTNDDDWIGLWAFTGCAFSSTVGYDTATAGTSRAINGLPVLAGTTYYFVISTWPTPDSTDFTINIEEEIPDCPVLGLNIGDPCDDGDPNTINDVVTEDCECEGVIPPDGTVCEAPIEINSLPYTTTDNTENYGDDYGSGDRPALAPDAVGNPSANYLNGDDVVYSYTSSANGLVDISVTDHGTYAGVFVFTGCSPFESTVGGQTLSSGTDDLEVIGLPVNAGTTYYIVISTWAAPQSTPYTLTVTAAEGCEGMPEAGTAAIDPNTGPSGTVAQVTVDGYTDAAGITRDWEAKDENGDWVSSGLDDDDEIDVIFSGEQGDVIELRYAVTCSTSSETAYSNVISFTIDNAGCIPQYNLGCSYNDYIASFHLDGDNGTALDVENGDCSEGEYIDKTAESVDLSSGMIYTADIAAGTSSDYVTIWLIDDEGSATLITERTEASSSGSELELDIPASVANGAYTMRVMLTWSSGNPTPCNPDSSYGQTIDYTANVTGLDTCPAPTDLTVDVMGPTYSNVSWSGNAADYEIAWGVSPYSPGDPGGSEFTTGGSTSYSVSTVASTEYDVYVRAICDDGNSDWTSTSFTSGEGDECPMPTGTTIDNVTENSADITWTPANATDDQWEVSITTIGQSPDDGIMDDVFDDPTYTATGLDADTEYFVYVRTVCSEDDSSEWFGGTPFTTDGEDPEPCQDPYNDDAATSDVYISNIEIAGIGIDIGNPDYDFNYTSNAMSATGYDVITNPTVTVYPGLEGAYTVSSGPTGNSNQYYYSVWVDFNQDGCFDAGEQVIWSNDVIWGGGIPNGEIGVTNVPMTWGSMAPGTYQARIRNSMVDHPMAEGNGDGEALDFTVEVITEDDAHRLLGIESQVFNNFTYYPNPVEDQLNLKASTPIELVEVYNLVGQKIVQKQPNALEVNLATDQLQAGVYLMNVTIDGSQKTFRVVRK